MCPAIRNKYLKSQMMMPTYEKSHQCNLCHKLFSNLEFQKDILTHSGEKPYQCNRCGKSFTMGDHLKEHMRTHTGEKAYHSNACEKNLSNQLEFKKTHVNSYK